MDGLHPKDIMKAEVIPLRFCGVPDQDFERARVALIPAPYDATTTYKSGSREGPLAILTASMQLDEPWGETEWHPAVEEQFFYTFEHALSFHGGSTGEHLASLSRFIAEDVVAHDKVPFLIGGEHSLAFASIAALYEKHKDFSILHLDAHPDLRPDYHGDRYSHASVMRRSYELGDKISLTEAGIRSVDRDIAKYIEEQEERSTAEKSLRVFYAPEISPEEIDNTLKPKLYISIDLDVFDHAMMPSVGTPQPGGLGWYQVIGLMEYVIARHDIIGMDVVELAPIPGMVAPDFAAAKLIWKMIEAVYKNKK